MPNTVFYHKEARESYRRWIDNVLAEDLCVVGCRLMPSDILRAHYTIVDYFLEKGVDESAVGGYGPRSLDLLISATTRQNTCFAGKNKWKTENQRLATLLIGLIKNHPFHDCNKRTALLSCIYYLYLAKRTPRVDQDKFEELMVDIAKNNLGHYAKKYNVKKGEDIEVRTIEKVLQKYTRKLDYEFRQLTFNQLNNIINNYGFGLENPKNNSIDIIQYGERKRFWQKEHQITKTRVGHIGFHGWTRKVSRNDLKKAREATGLTDRRGYDSKVFYEGVDPLKILVNDYSEPLERLAYR